ncbi:MAG: trypsin-like peptidase domain-containing protein [Alkalibacterium sp.]|uniref:S1C family serine protease n=1 Tax=Alkalibacterium TaxID=99906 RepID=UPI000EB8D486|nr:trypsin-like peptidase domain-containing protein [Alkalibacterium sp.]MDN6293185.1 trypsin-like peptidase domain-containing protein [Alkalibacterium sp.]MDN6294826.1 trypsin-like peptidase domain-containing protein [Alkalibacterium sp.]MDN6326787.1 trypsin-like peptidase domain-containing protein [Alkalibacterium sp.]MDN6397481.1 trypsin-like peptidase domain-containing protein [Alkalibacterium sp.]HAJ69699.1 serine protease [Alkalibacterium sp.]
MKKNVYKILLALSLSGAVLAGCDTIDSNIGTNNEENVEEKANEEGDVQISEIRVDVTSDITDAVKEVDESVVSIINMQKVGQNPYGWYEGSQQSDEEQLQQVGTGSGAVYKIDGDTAYIFTNNHVVDGSDAIEVLFKDGSRVEASIVGADLWTDLAVLSIDSKDISATAEFGDSENLTVGEPAIAIGSPLGTNFASSVTSGIISATGRTVPVDTNMDDENDWEMTAIQTDAAINPGNSGGPLINIAGQVVGINSMKISSSSIEGMGFAIPSNDAVDIISQLEKNGEVIRPVIGVSMVDLSLVSPQQQEAILNLPEDVKGGIVIAEVQSDGSAAEAGLETNDVIVSFDGEEVANGIELRKEIYDTEIGNEVEIEFYRDGELQKATLTMRSTAGETI